MEQTRRVVTPAYTLVVTTFDNPDSIYYTITVDRVVDDDALSPFSEINPSIAGTYGLVAKTELSEILFKQLCQPMTPPSYKEYKYKAFLIATLNRMEYFRN